MSEHSKKHTAWFLSRLKGNDLLGRFPPQQEALLYHGPPRGGQGLPGQSFLKG